MRLVLDPVAAYETRKALRDLQGFNGDFSRVHISVFPPGYDITHLKIVEDRRGTVEPASVKEPLLFVERAHLGVSLHDLLHGRVVGSLRLEHPKIAIRQPSEKESKSKRPNSGQPPDLSRGLAQAPALRIARVEMLQGELLFRTNQGGDPQRLWIHDLDMAVENLGTRRKETEGRPTTVSGHGTVAHSGEFKVFVSADPLAHPLSFEGQASLAGLRAVDLYEFIAPKTDMQATKGTIDVFATFRSHQGLISGGVKPVLKNILLRSTDEGLGARAKAWLADKAVELGSDRVPGRNAVATTIPIKGKIVEPDVQLWPAVLGVIRNAFVAGLESGFADLPPPAADEKQSVWQQAKSAIKKDAGPPKSQPAKEPAKGDGP